MKVILYFTQALLMKILLGFSILLLELDESYKSHHANQSVRPRLRTLHRDLSMDYRVAKTVNLELAFLPVEILGITGVDPAFLIRWEGGPKSEIQKNLVFFSIKNFLIFRSSTLYHLVSIITKN